MSLGSTENQQPHLLLLPPYRLRKGRESLSVVREAQVGLAAPEGRAALLFQPKIQTGLSRSCKSGRHRPQVEFPAPGCR